jgi:dipeptidase E
MKKRLLLLSNSTMPGEPYLGWPKNHIRDFLGKKLKKVLFFPFAGVTISHEDYTRNVEMAMSEIGYQVVSIYDVDTSGDFLAGFDAIMVGGGNTFQLAATLQAKKFIQPIRQAVENGKPFIGWSAGSNIACPTIRTTNDMPIVQPESFQALNLVPFQINAHYTEATLQHHGGETRIMRINEFLTANPTEIVVGLPEGSLLRMENGSLYFAGKGPCKVFLYAKEPAAFIDGDDLSFLLKFQH